jgi:hypothetical protein
VAVVPYLLGFHPAESLVVLGLIDRTVDFTVRYDLPPPDCTDFSGVATLIARQGIERVLILGYGPPDLVTATLDGVRGALAFARVKVDDMIRVGGGGRMRAAPPTARRARRGSPRRRSTTGWSRCPIARR